MEVLELMWHRGMWEDRTWREETPAPFHTMAEGERSPKSGYNTEV